MDDLRAALERTRQLAPTPSLPVAGVIQRRDRRRTRQRALAVAVALAMMTALLAGLLRAEAIHGQQPVPGQRGPMHNGPIDIFGYKSDGVGVLRGSHQQPSVVRCSSTCSVWSADWSVDGRLAYAAGLFAGPQMLPASGIHVFDAATGVDTQVTSSTLGEEDAEVAWSPDGSRLAIVRNSSSDSTLLITDGEGRSPTTVLTERGMASISSLSWSPDASEIAYQGPEHRIFLIDVGGGTPRQIADGTHPAWSPDGSEILFLRGWDLYSTSWVAHSSRTATSSGHPTATRSR
jgi:WD40 repeat protein